MRAQRERLKDTFFPRAVKATLPAQAGPKLTYSHALRIVVVHYGTLFYIIPICFY